jgi:hypothetical protein
MEVFREEKIRMGRHPRVGVDPPVRPSRMDGKRHTGGFCRFYPTVDKRNLFHDGDIAEKSSHSRGSTIDLTIVPVPMPAQEKYTPGQPLRACYLTARERFGVGSIDMGRDLTVSIRFRIRGT